MTDYVINAGGDVLARGWAAPGRPWRVGVRHPTEAQRVAVVLEVSDRAVATSGTYERGAHIVDPRTGEPATGGLAEPDRRRVRASGSSTPTRPPRFVMGLDGLRWVAAQPDHDALAITIDGRVVRTAGMDRYLASAA